MIKIISITLFILIGSCLSVRAQHTIEMTMTTCLELDENQTTKGMVACIQDARLEWLEEIQHLVNQLSTELDSSQLT
ncbi:MAG: hypothetical protein HKN09_06010, partial [Saprospiraceae bacterium]|nr:hypothetical protein [Saprospiraceae bacterium]